MEQIYNADLEISLKKCAYCGNAFKPKSEKKIYCSDTCRTLAYRKRKRLQEKNKHWIKKLDKIHWYMILIIIVEASAIAYLLLN